MFSIGTVCILLAVAVAAGLIGYLIFGRQKQSAETQSQTEWRKALHSGYMDPKDYRRVMFPLTKDGVMRLSCDELASMVATDILKWTKGPDDVGCHGYRWLTCGYPTDYEHAIPPDRPLGPNGVGSSSLWSPAMNMAHAWVVFGSVVSQLYSTRVRFYDALQEIARTQGGRNSDSVIMWPDVLTVLKDNFPRAVCQAALIAVACRTHTASITE